MDMRTALKNLGFDAHAYINKRGFTMREIAKDFVSTIKQDDLIVLYFSGHGHQDKDQNHAYGVDGDTLNIMDVLVHIGVEKPYAIVVFLDSCRSPHSDKWAKAVNHHFIKNLVIGFPCAQDQQAFAWPQERNSSYTKNLLRYGTIRLFDTVASLDSDSITLKIIQAKCSKLVDVG